MVITDFSSLQNYLQQANAFNLLGVNKIGIFGSFARGEEFNDIDILIEEDVSDEAIISFYKKIKKDITIPVDVVLSKFAEPIVLYRAKQDLKYAVKQ